MISKKLPRKPGKKLMLKRVIPLSKIMGTMISMREALTVGALIHVILKLSKIAKLLTHLTCHLMTLRALLSTSQLRPESCSKI